MEFVLERNDSNWVNLTVNQKKKWNRTLLNNIHWAVIEKSLQVSSVWSCCCGCHLEFQRMCSDCSLCVAFCVFVFGLFAFGCFLQCVCFLGGEKKGVTEDSVTDRWQLTDRRQCDWQKLRDRWLLTETSCQRFRVKQLYLFNCKQHSLFFCLEVFALHHSMRSSCQRLMTLIHNFSGF